MVINPEDRFSYNEAHISVEQLQNIDVFVGTGPNDRTNLCNTFLGPAQERGRVSVSCTRTLTGNSITVVKNTNGQSQSLSLCEVIAYGEVNTSGNLNFLFDF